MLIAGFQKMTLLDYPNKIAALVFTQGCNFFCGYCHNPEMIPEFRILPSSPELEPQSILDFLKRRVGLLDGVVVSGGEPTQHEDLDEFLEKIKNLGFLVKLDSNGSRPEVLQDLFERDLVDYIAMDIKHAPRKYQELTKNDCQEKIRESVQLIMKAGIPYEFRSTILPYYHDKSDIEEMGKMIEGAEQWHLQAFRPLKTLDKRLSDERAFSSKELAELKRVAERYVGEVGVRN